MIRLSRRMAAAGMVLSAAPLTRARAQTPTTWKAYTYWPVTTPAGAQCIVRIIDAVKQKTNGQLVISLHLGGSLSINAANITPAVADGVVELADDGFATGNVPIAAVPRLPMLFQSQEENAKATAILQPRPARRSEMPVMDPAMPGRDYANSGR